MPALLKIAVAVLLPLAALAGAAVWWNLPPQGNAQAHGKSTDPPKQAEGTNRAAGLVELVPGEPYALRLKTDGFQKLGVKLDEVTPAPPPKPLRLPGSLMLDTTRLVRIHARFPGELVALGSAAQGSPPLVELSDSADASTDPHALRYGDRVTKGQILAVVWSKDVGEKKSELVDAISRLAIDKALLGKLEAAPLVVSGRTIHEARRNYEADLIAVAKAERTLRSWRLTEEELEEIHDEARHIQNRETSDPRGDRTWAQTELRSPIDGIVVEKNYNVGDILDPSQDLFKIADLSRVQVLANAYEEDLPLMRNLAPEQRTWRIDIKADPNDVPMAGTFDIIGNIIDPAQHAGAVMGWLDNQSGRLSIGEFITATIDLPADAALVTVPASALIEDGRVNRVCIETSAARHEFELRSVAVAKRGRERVYIRREPRPNEAAAGARPLAAGEHVVVAGALELTAELRSLQAAAQHP